MWFLLRLFFLRSQLSQKQFAADVQKQRDAEEHPIVGYDLFRGETDQQEQGAEAQVDAIIDQFDLVQLFGFDAMDQQQYAAVDHISKMENSEHQHKITSGRILAKDGEKCKFFAKGERDLNFGEFLLSLTKVRILAPNSVVSRTLLTA